MARATAYGDGASPFGAVLLVTGPESLLADRAVAQHLARARAEEPELEITEADAGDLDGGRFAEITGGSLFATRRAAVIRQLGDLPPELADPLVEMATHPDPDCVLILVHPGGVKGKAVLDRLKKLKGVVDNVDCPAVKPYELAQFVTAEFRNVGVRVDGEVAQQLVEAVGHDARALAAAVLQLHDDAAGAITADTVRTYFAGRNEVTSFAVADAVLLGRTTVALEQLRWALSTGTAHVLVTSALASGLRGLGRYVTAPAGLREADLAREVGVPPWKLKSLRGQSRGWDQRGLAQALAWVARADADIKGAADNADFALERAVLAIMRCRKS